MHCDNYQRNPGYVFVQHTHAHTHKKKVARSRCSRSRAGSSAAKGAVCASGTTAPILWRHGRLRGGPQARSRRLLRLFRGHLRRLAAPKARQERSSSTRVTQCPPPYDRSVDSDNPWKNGNLVFSPREIGAVIIPVYRIRPMRSATKGHS